MSKLRHSHLDRRSLVVFLQDPNGSKDELRTSTLKGNVRRLDDPLSRSVDISTLKPLQIQQQNIQSQKLFPRYPSLLPLHRPSIP